MDSLADNSAISACEKVEEPNPTNVVIGAGWGDSPGQMPQCPTADGWGTDDEMVYALTWNPKWGEYAGDTAALVTLEMTNGVKVHWEGSLTNASCLNGWCADYFRAECRDATLELDQRWLREIRGATYEKPLATDLPLLPEQDVWMNPWLAEMFCDWVSGQRDDHPTAVADNIQNAAFLYAAVESAESGEPVDVQAYLRGHLQAESKVS